MNRQKVVELQLELKRMIELNKESIKLQTAKFGAKNNAMIPYLEGFSAAYQTIYDKLSKEC
jgi:hypothetical protein